MTSTQAGWYLVHCKPQEDKRALENLARQGFFCYLPTLKVERLRNGRKAVTEEPLFPRYVFVRLNEINDHWRSIRSTRGVSQIVCCKGCPLPVRDRVVEDIRIRLAARPETVPCFQPGDRVQITEGPFARFEAIFLKNHGEERVILLLNLLQTDQAMSFALESVRKVG